MASDQSATVLFPGAGSFGGEFRPLLDRFGPAASMVRYPGRSGRNFGIPAPSFELLVLSCRDQVVAGSAGRTVLFGHSFGAYVAYATALELHRAGQRIAALVVSGADAPSRLSVPESVTGSPAATRSYLEGVDPELLAEAPSDDWRDIVVETVAQDLRLLGEFDTGAAGRLSCPVFAVRGAGDPISSDEGLADWRQNTDGDVRTRRFDGGHSDFLRSAACADWYRQLCDILY